MHLRLLLPLLFVLPLAASAQTPCVDGQAGEFPCDGVDLLAHLTQAELGFPGANGNDIWGWTDPLTGDEYALMYTTQGTSFVNVSNPTSPEVIGILPSEISFSCTWRDGKVANDYVFIVADCGSHGIQVFDLTRLRDVTSPPETFDADAVYDGVTASHNIDVLEEAGLAFPVGSNVCSAGLEMVDISDPLNPTQAGCYNEDNYVHDTQCVRYDGPDTDYTGSDICFNSTGNSDNLSIVDISDPSTPQQVSEVFYQPGASYSHQGWLSDDARYFFLNDELTSSTGGTRTYVFDVEDLDNPEFLYMNEGTTPAAAHNLYILDGLMHQSNYRAGYRLWDVQTPGDQSSLSEIAWFDTHPESDDGCPGGCTGAWSNYPYFESGIVVLSDIARGLFVLDPNPTFHPVTAGMSFSETEAEPNDVVTLTATVTNQTEATQSGVGFSDTLPEGLTFDGNLSTTAGSANESDGTITWDVDLSVGASETISFDVLIDEGASGGDIENIATISPPSEDAYDISASIQVQARPANDDNADAIVLTENGMYDGTNVDATTEDGVPTMTCGGGGDRVDVWWSFTAAADGEVTISTEGSDFDTVLGLHDSSLSELACNDDNGSGGLWSLLEGVPVTEGETYLIRIAGYNTAEGTIQFELDAPFAIADEASPEELADVISTPKPNPATGLSTFTVAVERGQNVTVEVFDATGRRVQTLYDGALSPGMSETLALDASGLPAGVYVIRATGEDFSKTRRVTVIR